MCVKEVRSGQVIEVMGPQDGSYLRVLVINPNTSTNMTNALEPVVKELPFSNVGRFNQVYSVL